MEISHKDLVRGFNKWMHEYTKNPDGFLKTHRAAIEFLSEKLSGKPPSYGERCAVVLVEYIGKKNVRPRKKTAVA